MKPGRSHVRFAAANAGIWLLMVAVLVVVPDTLEPSIGLEVARVVGWAVAGTIWVISIEAAWRARMGPIARFVLQTALWISAALLAMWISDQVRIG